jgi:phosphoribosyl 1,2-cyclic phosphate phosphodiesterase
MDPLFFAVSSQAADGSWRQVLYAHDTGPFPEDTWAYLESRPDNQRFAFDLVSIDATHGPAGVPGTGHMNVDQVAQHRDRLAASGLLKPNARVFANHFSHNGTPAHPELARLLAGTGLEPSHDGLTVDL